MDLNTFEFFVVFSNCGKSGTWLCVANVYFYEQLKQLGLNDFQCEFKEIQLLFQGSKVTRVIVCKLLNFRTNLLFNSSFLLVRAKTLSSLQAADSTIETIGSYLI